MTMAFLRRKSGVYHEDVYQEDFETHRRRRLSKPLTNSSHTSLPSLSTQQMTRRKSRSKAAHEASAPTTPVYPNESREALRAFLFTSTSEVDMITPKPKRSSVAVMTAMLEKSHAQASTSQLSLVSPALPQRPMSHMQSTKRPLDSHMSSVSSLASKDRYADADFGTVSPTSSTEHISHNPAPRARRAASFTPGIATRAVSLPRGLTDEKPESAVVDADAIAFQDFVKECRGSSSEESSVTAPQNDRSGTPTDLEYPNIGRMNLGSLRVTNGAPSPAPSELSRLSKLLLVPLRRENSSIYPESEIGTVRSRKSARDLREDGAFPSTADDAGKPKPDVFRTFSFKPGTESRFNQTQLNSSTSRPPTNSSDMIEEEDQTRMLAEDYMAALPTSPYAEARRPASLVIMETSAQAKPDSLTPSALFNAMLDSHGASHFPNPYGIPESTTSQDPVRRYVDETHGRRSFADETLGSSPAPNRPGSSSTASFFSAPEADSELEERFKSAVELQPARTRSKSPKKHSRRSPQRSPQRSPLRQALMQNSLQPSLSNVKADSGYSSNNTSSSAIPLSSASGVGEDDEHTAENQERHEPRFPFRTNAQKLGKPLLVEPTPSTKVPSPISVKIESVSAMTSTTSFDAAIDWLSTTPAFPPPLPSTTGADSTGNESALVLLTPPQKANEKQRKKLQKVRRKSTADAVGALVIQRLASVESFNVPPVSNTARSTLARRSETIPELERTFKTQNHTTSDKNESNLSLTLVMQTQDLRFPSPVPADEERKGRSRAQSRSRKRSLSRPRTWFGWSKDEKEEVPQQKPAPYEPVNISLSDLGSVTDLIGDSPYDMARAKPHTDAIPPPRSNRPELVQRRTSPCNIGTRTSRPKSMMDDETAAQLSKARRTASIDRDGPPPFRASFEDRGRNLSRNPHQARMSIDGASWSRPRSFMDDEMALKVSKARRAASTDRHRRSVSRTSFDDRGGIPGKFPHQARLSMHEAPPLPPMPSPAEINRRFSYRQEPASRTSQLTDGNVQCSKPLSVDEPDNGPLAPRHSPCPSYVDHQEQKESSKPLDEVPLPHPCSPDPATVRDDGQYDHVVEGGETPPPPCHSPRPVDVTREERPIAPREINWSSQANAWRARRQSAIAASRESWHELEHPTLPVLQQSPQDQGLAHAVQQGKPISSQDYLKLSDVRWGSGTYQEQHYSPHMWYPNQPEGFQDTFYSQPHHDYGYGDDQYYQDQYPRAGSECYKYANNYQHSLSHEDYNHQQKSPYKPYRPCYGVSQSSIDPRSNSHGSQFVPNFHQELPNHDEPQAHPQHRSYTFDEASTPTPRHSRNPRSASRPPNVSRRSRRSLAEELHPEKYDVPSLPSKMSRPPHIGRYSGGLEYNYNRHSGDFDGSAGTGSVSPVRGNGVQGDGKKRNSRLEMQAYGVDLTDVPRMSVPVGATGSRMVYR